MTEFLILKVNYSFKAAKHTAHTLQTHFESVSIAQKNNTATCTYFDMISYFKCVIFFLTCVYAH